MRVVMALAITALSIPNLGADGCGADDALDPHPLADFAFTKPDGFAELVRGNKVEVGWTISPFPGYELDIEAVDGDRPPVLIDFVGPGSSSSSIMWDGLDHRGPSVPFPDAPAGNYTLRATARAADAGTVVDTFDGDATHLVVVQGVRFRDATLAFTGAQPQAMRQITLASVTREPLEMAVVADPDVAVDGDELSFAEVLLPGELAEVARTYPFTGMSSSGTPVPAGRYTIAALLRVANGPSYRIDGPTLTWAP